MGLSRLPAGVSKGFPGRFVLGLSETADALG
jgi:hypothetical protein